MSGVVIHQGTSTEALADDLARRLDVPRDDPFAQDLICVPHSGLQRWLTQQLARRIGRTDEGICAGVEWATLDGLASRLARDVDDRPDPWQPERLRWTLLALITDSTDPVLHRLRDHVEASREAVGVTRRLAGLFGRYATWRPEMLRAWADGRDVDDEGGALLDDAWQPVLYRHAVTALGQDPFQIREALVSSLAAEPQRFRLPAEILVFAPRTLNPAQVALLEGLAVARDVVIWRHTTRREPSGLPSHLLNLRLGGQEAAAIWPKGPAVTVGDPAHAPATVLGWLQSDLAADGRSSEVRVASPDDHSVQLHSCHGLDRQVEVLRDAITGYFQRDPSLEPRDVVIACADLDAATPLITSAFSLPETVSSRHPACDFRVQLADRTAAQINPLVGVLDEVLGLPGTRVSVAQVLDLLASSAVAARFGIRSEDLPRLTALIEQAGIRWGLNTQHRSTFGLDGFAQNTWTAGLHRLLLGICLDEDGLPTIGTTLPVDDVESSDVPLIGALSELISRLARLLAQFEQPATVAEWARRGRTTIDLLTLVRGNDGWQAGHLAAGLSRLAERGSSGALLSVVEFRRAVAEEFAETPARPLFGNGSLSVCSLSSARNVPHRVVCLLGLDDTVFPRPPARDGDDLMLRHPRPADPDVTDDDRQALLDAITSARDALVITFAGRDPATNHRLHPTAVISDLTEALDRTATTRDGTPLSRQCTTEHRLQPFDPAYFDGRLTSFDPAGFRGATALLRPRTVAAQTPIPVGEPLTAITLESLIAFFRHPARAFLKTRLGLYLGSDDPPPAGIPIELDGLKAWTIGDRSLRLVRAGADLDTVQRAEWLRGTAPPGVLGTDQLAAITTKVGRIVRRLPAEAQADPRPHDLALDVAGVRLSGRVLVRDGLLISAEYSRVAAPHRLAAWLELLVARAAGLPVQGSVVAGPSTSARFAAPDPDQAAAELEVLLGLVRLGLDAPLPLPARVSAELMGAWQDGLDPFDPFFKPLLRAWERELDDAWRRYYTHLGALIAVPNVPEVTGRSDNSLLVAATRAVWQPLQRWETLS